MVERWYYFDMIYLSMMGLRRIGVELFSVCTQLQTVDELMESASTLPGSSLGRELNFFPDRESGDSIDSRIDWTDEGSTRKSWLIWRRRLAMANKSAEERLTCQNIGNGVDTCPNLLHMKYHLFRLSVSDFAHWQWCDWLCRVLKDGSAFTMTGEKTSNPSEL